MSDLRQAAVQLVPQLRERAAEAERARKLPPASLADLRELGLFRAFVPRIYGGDQRTLAQVLDAMTELAVGCASTAWVGCIAAIHNIAVCWLDKAGQEEIFGDGPDVVITSSVAPSGSLLRTPGGFLLSGRWGFSSGVDYAAWLMLGATLKTGLASRPIEYFLCFVRSTEMKLIDDWHVAGLRATGSKSLELTNVSVPDQRALLLRTVAEGTAPGLALHPQPFYRLPWNPLFMCAFPPAALGTAVAMLEGLREYTLSRINRFSGRGFVGSAGTAMRLAQAAAQLDAARLMFRNDLATLDRNALDEAPLPPEAAARIAYHVPYIIDTCSRAVLQLFRGSGGRALHDSNPLQRHFRDIHAMTQHAAMDMDYASEMYGRALLENPSFDVGVRECQLSKEPL